MRVTTNTLYSKFIYDQQNTYDDLNTVTNQLSSGMKIDKIYDDPTVFTNTLRLDSESNSLTQVLNTAKTAQSFADNTDTTLNDMTKTLDSFKTKLLQAANADNNDTSYGALAEELQGLRDHLQTLANTSIDGKFLFSGTAFNTKPISDNGDYNGNDKKIKAKLGSDVDVAYNIDGASLFQGIDTDYSKHISTNVQHFDALKENPEFVVMQDGKLYIDRNIKLHSKTAYTEDPPVQESLSTDSEIRMLTGVEDIAQRHTKEIKNVNTQIHVFDGGLNDTIYSVMDTSTGINDNGDEVSFDFLEIKDKNGKTTSLNVDNTTTLNDLKDQIENLLGEDIKYEGGQFVNQNGEPLDITLTSYNDTDNDATLDTDKDSSIKTFSTYTYEDGTSYFYLSGRKPDGDTFNEKIELSNSSKVSDLLDKIGQAYGNTATTKAVDVSMNQFGQIEIKDTTTGKMVTDFSLVASDKDEASVDDLVKNGDYVVSFTKSNFAGVRDIANPTAQNKNFDNRVFTLNTEFRTIDDENYAKNSDTIFNVLGEKGLNSNDNTMQTLDHIKLSGTDTDGNNVDVTLSIDNTTTMQDLIDEIKNNFGDVNVSLENGKLMIEDNTIDKDGVSNLSFSMDAQDANDDSLSMFARMDGMTSDKTAFSVDGDTVSSNVAQVDKNTQMFATENTKMIDVSGSDDIDGKRLDINYTDKDGNPKRAYITLRDTADADGHLSTFTLIGDDGSETTYDIYDAEGNKTPIHDITTITQELDPTTCELCTKEHTTQGITYKQFDDVIGMLVSGNLPDSNTPSDYNNAVEASSEEVDVGLQDGKLYVKDKNNSKTNIKLEINDHDTDSFDGGDAPAFTFNSNNAITIDEAKVDIFHQLDDIIQSVREGRVRMDGDEDNPRDIGIQGGIELIDHLEDHVIKKHTEIGAVSASLQNTQDRTNMLIVHTETLKSDVIDVDMGQASMELQKLTLNYQAMLSTIAKVNNLSLVNYM